MKRRRFRARWDRHEIRAEIARKGSNLRRVALEAGLSESTCRKALQVPLPAGEAAIADFLGLTVQELWPDRYPTLPSSTANHGTNGPREASLKRATDQTSRAVSRPRADIP